MQKSTRRALLAGLFLLGVLAVSAARAELTIRKSTGTYEVKGGTAAELYEQMETLGPIDRTGSERHWARTKWHISWQFEYEYKVRKCEMTQVWTELKLEFILPFWTEKTGASAALRSSWGDALLALQAHEQGHADLAVETARRLEESLRRMEPSISCERLRADANRLGRSYLEKLRDQDVAYDRDTDHGRNTIPPLRD